MSEASKVVDGLKSMLRHNDYLDFAEAEIITEAIVMIEPKPEPNPCPSCRKGAVVLQDTGRQTWSIGCPQAYFRPETEEEACKLRMTIVGQSDRETAVLAWNEAVISRS